MSVRFVLVFFILSFALLPNSWGQKPAYNIGINALPGFLIAHREDSRNLEAHTLGFEIQLDRINITEKPWAQTYVNPRIGLNIMYMDLGQPNLTGKVFSIGPNFTTSLVSTPTNTLNLRAGTGMGYLTKRFDVYTNRRNQAIGSNLNGMIQVLMSWEHRFERLPLQSNVGIGLTHFSNGALRVPNLGVNMPHLQLGLSYRYGKVPSKYEAGDTIRNAKWGVIATYAFKERNMSNPKGFNIVNLSLERLVRINPVRHWRYGADLYFDKTHYFIDNKDSDLKGLRPWEMTEVGVYGGHQWLIYRVDLVMDVGLYAYRPSTHKFITYQRIGFKYHIHDNWFLRAALKTHFGVADFFDWGVGYKL